MAGSRFDRFIGFALKQDTKAMARMLDEGYGINTSNKEGETAFSYCCANNKLRAAKFLARRGAEINTTDSGGGTPLDWAVCWSSPKSRQWLRGLGARRNSSHRPWPWPRSKRKRAAR